MIYIYQKYLNFYIISQLIQQTVTEIDITGECKTTYEPAALSNGTTLIYKTKSAGDCTRTPVWSQTTLPKQLQNVPIITADVSCKQTVTGGVMTETHCEELIALKPLSSDNQATTLIKTKMQLISETSGVIPAGKFLITSDRSKLSSHKI